MQTILLGNKYFGTTLALQDILARAGIFTSKIFAKETRAYRSSNGWPQVNLPEGCVQFFKLVHARDIENTENCKTCRFYEKF